MNKRHTDSPDGHPTPGRSTTDVASHEHDGRTRIVILGPPGSGKGTHARQLAKRFSIPHISTGALLREEIEVQTPTGRKVAEAVESGALASDDAIVRIVERAVHSEVAADGWILDGAPRTTAQAEELASLIEGDEPAIVISLDVDEDELRRRLDRRRTDEGRPDDDPNVVDDRMALWAHSGPPLLERYARRGQLVRVDGSGTISETSARVRAAVETAERDRSPGARRA